MSSQGSQAKFALEIDATFDGSSEPYEFFDFDPSATTIELIESEGIRGTRSHAKERVRQGLHQIGFSVSMNPSPTELDRLLPRILGANESADSFALAETLPEVWALIDVIGKCHRYNQGKIAKATFSGTSGQPVKLTMDFVFMSLVEQNAGTFPAITVDTDSMYVFHDSSSGLTLHGTGSRKFEDFAVTIDNSLDARFMNSQTATALSAQDRLITFSCRTPYTSSETDLFTTPLGSSAGAAAALVFTNGNQSLTFTFANLKSIATPPPVAGRGEIKLPLNYRAYTSSTTKELVVTHDSTP